MKGKFESHLDFIWTTQNWNDNRAHSITDKYTNYAQPLFTDNNNNSLNTEQKGDSG